MDTKNLDLGLLVTLEALLAEGNVTRAARRLNLSQPALSARLADGTRLVVFDETGRSFTSQGFVDHMLRARDDRSAAIGFVVGGPDGIDPEFRARAALVLAFGAATLPHQIVRALVAEQVYRALTILHHHPYHRI